MSESTQKKCIFCKNLFETSNLKRVFCYRTSCRIKFDFLLRHKKGQDPVVYYNDLVKKGTGINCWVCEDNFKPHKIRQFFTRMCGDCEKSLKQEKNERLFDEILENPRKFLDSLNKK